MPSNSSEFDGFLFDGNPFVSKLNEFILDETQLCESLNTPGVQLEGLVGKPNWYKEALLEKGFFQLPPHGYALYTRIMQLIRMGYINRNPATDDYDKYLHTVGLEAPMPESLKDSGTAMLYRGPSGMGKTKLINLLLTALPRVINHEPSEETGFRALKQVLWVKIDMEVLGTRAGLFAAIAEELDRALGTRFAPRVNKQPTLTLKRLALIKYCRMACLGILVIDDAQWALKQHSATDDKKVSNAFIEQLFNQLGVPMVFVITPEQDILKNSHRTTTRRISHNGNYEELPYQVDDAFWQGLVRVYFTNFLSVPESLMGKEFFQCVHYYSEGNLSNLKRIAADFLQKEPPNPKALFQCIDVAYRNTKNQLEGLKVSFTATTMQEVAQTASETTQARKTSKPARVLTDQQKSLLQHAKEAMQLHGSGGSNGR